MTAGAPDARRVTAVVGVLSLAVFMSSLDLFIVNLAFPSIGRQYPGTSLSSLSWVLNAYTIVFAAVLVPACRWADRIGRRRALVAGLAAFSVGRCCAGWRQGGRADRGQGHPGGRRRGDGARVAVAPAGRGSGSGRAKALGTWSALGALGAARPGDRRQPGRDQLALGVLGQPAGRAGRHGPGGQGRAREQRRPGERQARPDRRGTARRVRRLGRARPGQGARLGMGLGRLHRAPGRLAGLRHGHGGALAAASLSVIELELLHSRTFSGAFAASILYYAGFGAFVLSTVEFLTGVWHYSAVLASLAIAPGPLMSCRSRASSHRA